MKFIRSVKCSTRFATQHKRQELTRILVEYGRVCNFFIRKFWEVGIPGKAKLLKDIIDLPLVGVNPTWLSFTLRQVAAREAIDMIRSVKERWKNDPMKVGIPVHKGNRMSVPTTIAELQPSRHTTFDAWLHLNSIGNKTIFDVPVKYHKQFNKWSAQGKLLSACILTSDYVQFAFEIESGPKSTVEKVIGIDTGIKALASTSDGNQYGRDIEECIRAIKRCKHGSNNQKRRRRALRQRMDEVVKETIDSGPQLIVVENLKNLNHKTRISRRLNKSVRRSLGSWNYRYWLSRLQMATEENRIVFRSVNPAYTSQRCFACGHTERGNRKGEVFCCLKCEHSGNADVNAANNILHRFLQGPYGALYKPKDLGQVSIFKGTVQLNR